MAEFGTDELLIEEYVLKRLIYVNSANHGYSELLLDEHLAMFGQNNVGKTASLAGTKLLLYPEVNFNQCEKKFKFIGNHGTFSQEDSYDFYFPDSKSFIALEVLNPEGAFCMVLYKTNNYSYGRFFIPLSYDELRPVFWDGETCDFNSELSIKSVKQFTIENGGLQTSDPAEIRALMFEGMRGTKKERQFCVLPMKDSRVDSIQAFKNIYQLAFDIKNSEENTLPNAIATLLEMGRGRDEERLSADLQQIADEYSEIVATQDQLQKLKNAEPVFKRVDENFKKLISKHKYFSALHRTLVNLLARASSSFNQRHEQVSLQLREARAAKTESENKATAANEEFIRLRSKIELKEEDKKRYKIKSQKIKALFVDLGFKTIEETLSYLDDKCSEINSRLTAYKQEDGIKKQLQADIAKRQQLQNQKAELSAYLADQSGSIAYQLNCAKSANIIYSLNKNLALAISPMTAEQRELVLRFTSMFAFDKAGMLTFLEKPLKDTKMEMYDLEKTIVEGRHQLADIERELKELIRRIEEHQGAVRDNDLAMLVANTEAELNAVEEKRNDIRIKDETEKRLQITEGSINKDRDRLTALQISLEEAKNQVQKLTSESNILQMAMRELEEEDQRLKRYQTVFQRMLPGERNVFLDVMADEIPEVTLTDEWFDNLHSLSGEIRDFESNIKGDLYNLLSKAPIDAVDQHQHYDSLNDLYKVVSSYADEYATLEYDLKQLYTSISSHNQFVSNQISELKTSKQFISNFVNEINEELNSKHVSNLSEINLRPVINARFESLLSTLEKQDIVDETLLEPEFYQSLTRFAEHYIDKKSRKLKMQHIIDRVSYEYTLEETGERVTKSQSGGTSSTITAFVLSVLLKKIIPDYVSLKMPIIVDEVSTLDFQNTKATIQQIGEHGFSIFCATPTFSGFISQNVGRWIMIDRARMKQPRVSKCHLHILPEHVESFGRINHEA
ncbi:MAG: hypothetical protein COB00_17410 [Alcanivorax sp.]|nr:MAG: hypothetical protein COB00_17410 [Alcanivorax sp.]